MRWDVRWDVCQGRSCVPRRRPLRLLRLPPHVVLLEVLDGGREDVALRQPRRRLSALVALHAHARLALERLPLVSYSFPLTPAPASGMTLVVTPASGVSPVTTVAITGSAGGGAERARFGAISRGGRTSRAGCPRLDRSPSPTSRGGPNETAHTGDEAGASRGNSPRRLWIACRCTTHDSAPPKQRVPGAQASRSSGSELSAPP